MQIPDYVGIAGTYYNQADMSTPLCRTRHGYGGRSTFNGVLVSVGGTILRTSLTFADVIDGLGNTACIAEKSSPYATHHRQEVRLPGGQLCGRGVVERTGRRFRLVAQRHGRRLSHQLERPGGQPLPGIPEAYHHPLGTSRRSPDRVDRRLGAFRLGHP